MFRADGTRGSKPPCPSEGGGVIQLKEAIAHSQARSPRRLRAEREGHPSEPAGGRATGQAQRLPRRRGAGEERRHGSAAAARPFEGIR